MKRVVILLAVVLALFSMGAVGTFAQSDDTGALRFVHVIPGVAAIDIYTDNQLTVSNLDFGEASNYINVPAGSHQITVRPRGVTTILWQQEVNASADLPQTLIASTIDPLQFVAYEDDFTPVALGTTRFKAIHAISNASGVDILVEGDEVVSNLQYGDFIGTFDIPADVYELVVFPNGESEENAILPALPVSLASNTSYQVILYGTASIPDALVLSAPTAPEAGSGFLRLAHTVADAPAVDVYANDTLIAPGLNFGQVTEHLAIPADTYDIELRVAGETTSLLEASLVVEEDVAVSAVALGTGDAVTMEVFTDEIGDISADTALVSVINTIPGDSSITATLADGTVLAEDVAFATASEVVSIDPIAAGVSFTITVDGQTATLDQGVQQFYGGAYYNLFALGATMFSPPLLTFNATSLAEGPASAPGAGDVVVAQVPDDTGDNSADTSSEVSTEAPGIVETTPAPVVTEAPAPTEVAQQPTAVPTLLPPAAPPTDTPRPTGRIILDPGVNLQLRQYPSRDALSLGLAPSGTILEILGREGAPVDLDGNELPITNEAGEEIEWVDPVTLLEDENQDLNPEATWVHILYHTPDGGQITAWTLPLYLDINDSEGEDLALRNLLTIPQNRAGEAVDTAITPPPVQEDRVTVRVTNLDQGVNLNVRRTAEPSGEVLARVPSGTVLEVLGVDEAEEWVFARYTTSEGGSVTGWLSAQYVEYQLNGEATDTEFLKQFDLLPILDKATTRGSVGASVPSVVQPTRDPLRDAFVTIVQLDPGANLNLRRDPNVQAEVIGRIPTGTNIILEGRTEDNAWLRTSFEGVSGWVSADFVFAVTFNGEEVEISQLPVVTPVTEEPETTEEPENTGG